MIPEVNIRRAMLADAELLAGLNKSIQQIHTDAYPYLFKQPNNFAEVMADFRARILADADGFVFIVEANGQAVGYIYARVVIRPANAYIFEQKYMLVDQIAIEPDYQNRGYGKRLMQAVRDEAVAHGIRRVSLNTYEFNVNAQQFYTKMGFERMGIQFSLDLTEQ